MKVFRLVPGTKRPQGPWSNKDTWEDPEQIPQGECFGLPCGPANGIWVLDLDKKNDKDGHAELEAHRASFDPPLDLPETYTVRTPSGGLHMYWAWDRHNHPGNRTNVLPGIDVRSAGGYVCAGGAYETVVDVDVADAPDWLVTLCKTKDWHGDEEIQPVEWTIPVDHPEFGYRLDLAKEWLGHFPPCISGQGGQARIWQVASRLSRTYEFDVETSMGLLGPYNARCQPPWDQDELRRHLTRAQTHGTGATGMFSKTWTEAGAQKEGAQKEGHPPAAGKSAGGLGGKSADGLSAEGPLTVSAEEPWRKVPKVTDLPHVYSFDLAVEVAGGDDKLTNYSQKEITKVFTGPGAAPAWLGVWQQDLFRQKVLAFRPPLVLDAETTGPSEVDWARIQMWCACQQMKASPDQIRQACQVAAGCASFHPVRDYLGQLTLPALDDARGYFSGVAGRLWGAPAERDAIESAHLLRFAVAAVRRVRQPGAKVDTMLVLQGEQGHNKSRFCALLFGEFFRDQMPSLDSKDASIALEGYWGIEIAEMTAFSKSAESTKKEFLSRCEDKYRPVWARDTRTFQRQCVFIGTTNDDDFLRDPTGDRRYDVCEIMRAIDLDAVNRDEFWAAACVLESAGVSHFQTATERAEADAGAGQRFAAEDAWTPHVLKWVRDHAISHQCGGEEWVLAQDALTSGVVLGVDKQDAKALGRVRGILRRYCGPSRAVWIDARTQRAYRRTGLTKAPGVGQGV